MKNTLLRISVGAATIFAPALALAQFGDNTQSAGTLLPGGNDAFNILGIISGILGVVIPILVTLAVIYVIWGVISYITAGDDDKQAKAKATILHGVIALFVIVSIWGLVAILNQTFDVGQGGGNTGNCQPIFNTGNNDFMLPPNCY